MNCGGMVVSADFLYWKAENHGFSYGYEMHTQQGELVRVSPSWEPAFRVGLGWNTPYDFWDVFVNYTWYRNRSSESKEGTDGLFPLWPLSDSITANFESVSAKVRFLLNMGDLEIGRMLYLSKSLAVRPILGIRGGTLHQRFTSRFYDPLGELFESQTFRGINNYWGIGPRSGCTGQWDLSSGFSLMGKFAAAFLYGKTKASSKTQQAPIDAIVFSTLSYHTDEFYQLAPNLEMALGLQWQSCFWCEKMFFKMNLSWETNYWWNQFNLPFGLESFAAPMPSVGNQPFTTEGLTLNLELDF